MNDKTAKEMQNFGASDAELAAKSTVFGPAALAGKRVLITGGGSGIGKATAWLTARLGARIVIAGRTKAKLDKVTNGLRAHGYDADVRTLNIRDEEQVRALFADLTRDMGGIDVLVNSAGGQFPQDAIDFTSKGWRAVIDTNLNGTWWVMQAAAQAWRARGEPGNIVNLVTVIDGGMMGVAHTSAARAGVVYLSKMVAVEWAPLNIRINCIAPGVIETEGHAVYSEAVHAGFPRSNPMRRCGTPWEIAEMVAFLASDASKFMTGTLVTMDGGGALWGELWTAGKPDYFAE